MRKWYQLLLALTIVLFSASNLLAELTLVSSSPADGATNVANPATFELTFSAPIDTNATFKEPGDFFLGIEFWMPDSIGEPEDIQFSPDFKTVTVSGLVLPEDNKVTVLLTGAKSQSGDYLDRPYMMTFTTGSSLPAGSISGTVNFPEGSGDGSVVALFPENNDDDFPVAAAIAGPQYTINYIADGSYQLMSVKDTNGDYAIDPSSGDAVGFYDTNSDDEPDVVVISGENNVSGIDLTLVEPQPEKARARFNDFQSAAQAWASDAILVSIQSDELTPAGLSFEWSYLYYSSSQDEFMAFSIFANAIFSDSLNGDYQPEKVALPANWVDSDVVSIVAESNGGGDFRAEYTDVEVDASLEFFRTYHAEDPHSEGIEDTGEKLAVWKYHYWSESAEEYYGFEANAITGETLESDAMDNLEAANSAAQNWSSDAELIKIMNDWDLREDGLTTAWGYIYRSASLDSVVMISAVSGVALTIQPTEYYENWPHGGLPAELCSSADALAIAQQESEAFRTANPDFYITAELAKGLTDEESRPVWRIGYWVNGGEGVTVDIDAEACALYITGVAASHDQPKTFILTQNYPNPFNPTTSIRFNLPEAANVKLVIYNAIGQEIRTLINSRQAEGIHNVVWDGTNSNKRLVPSGIYMYRINAGDFTATRKMVLTR